MNETHAEGADTLLGVLAEANDAGYGATLTARTDGISCGHCDQTFAADEATVDAVRRLEGASDPSDMLLVASLPCPRCGTRGTLVLGYGPEASDADTDVLSGLDLRDVDHRP